MKTKKCSLIKVVFPFYVEKIEFEGLEQVFVFTFFQTKKSYSNGKIEYIQQNSLVKYLCLPTNIETPK